MARQVRFHDTIEHAFVHAEGEEPQVVSGNAVQIAQSDIPDTDLKRSLWRVQAGAELQIPEKDADKLANLKDADGNPYIGEPNSEPPQRTAQVYDVDKANRERTHPDEARRIAADAGHTPEGEIVDHEKHVDYAERQGFDAGGPAAAVHEARKRAGRPGAAQPAPSGQTAPAPQAVPERGGIAGPAGSPTTGVPQPGAPAPQPGPTGAPQPAGTHVGAAAAPAPPAQPVRATGPVAPAPTQQAPNPPAQPGSAAAPAPQPAPSR